MKPWEKYAQPQQGPWTKYQAKEPDALATAGPESQGYLKNAAAAFGKSVADAGLGIKQMGTELGAMLIPDELRAPNDAAVQRGALQREAVAKRAVDAPLMKMPGSGVGQFAGNVAMTVPALLVPGANTIKGASLVGGLMGAAQPTTQSGERLTNVATGTVLGGVGQYAGGKIAGVAVNKLAERGAAAKALQAGNAERDRVAQEAMKAGYKIPPATINPTVGNRALESFSGKVATEQAAREHNQAVTNALARKAVGLKGEVPITSGALKGVRTKAGNVYERASSLGPIRSDEQYLSEIDALLQSNAGAFGDLGAGTNDKVASLVSSLKAPEVDSGDVVKAIGRLRASSKKNWRASAMDPDRGDVARAQDAAVDALEGLLERHAGKVGSPQMVKELRKARELIAKTYSVEAALKKGSGDVLAPRLALQLDKGKPLSGPLRTIAETASTFDRATARPRGSSVSHLDALMSTGLGGVGVGMGNPVAGAAAALAWPSARYGARKAIMSDLYQSNNLIPNYVPRQVDLLALNQGAKQLGRTAPIVGLLGTDPEQE